MIRLTPSSRPWLHLAKGCMLADNGSSKVFVVAGKSVLAFRHDGKTSSETSKHSALVQTYDEKPRRRLFELLQSQGV